MCIEYYKQRKQEGGHSEFAECTLLWLQITRVFRPEVDKAENDQRPGLSQDSVDDP